MPTTIPLTDIASVLAAPLEQTDKIVLLRLLTLRAESGGDNLSFYNGDEATTLGIAKSTLGRALSRLAEQGFLVYTPGVGRASSQVALVSSAIPKAS